MAKPTTDELLTEIRDILTDMRAVLECIENSIDGAQDLTHLDITDLLSRIVGDMERK